MQFRKSCVSACVQYWVFLDEPALLAVLQLFLSPRSALLFALDHFYFIFLLSYSTISYFPSVSLNGGF